MHYYDYKQVISKGNILDADRNNKSCKKKDDL